ncbi:MAG TPA: response regulator [Stellaceae bacterium]|nr:response regulator [Stellaceae bacterium]
MKGNERNFLSSSPGAASDEAPGAAERRRASILIVEDEALIASYIQEVLEESGFAVAGIASSGPEAISLASTSKPDLALVDIKLAGRMDGIEVALLMRTRFKVPSIFLSGLCDPDTTARAQAASPLGFLEKPFRPSQVFNALERALERMHQS